MESKVRIFGTQDEVTRECGRVISQFALKILLDFHQELVKIALKML